MNRAIDEVENGQVPAVVLVCRNSTDTGGRGRVAQGGSSGNFIGQPAGVNCWCARSASLPSTQNHTRGLELPSFLP